MTSDSEEITGKIVNILAYQAVITAQGENYTGEKDWALNKLRDLFKEELQKAVQEEKPKHCCCLLEDSKVVERCKLHGDELQKAHQAGIDEAVEIVQSLRVKEVHDEPCDGYCETWSCPWPNSRERNRTLDATIKALQDKK